MKRFEKLSKGDDGFYGTVIEIFKPFKIIIEECMNFSCCEQNFGHVFFIYQYLDGKDLRTHMVSTFDDAKKCAEKIKNDIINQGSEIASNYDNFLNTFQKLHDPTPKVSAKGIFGKEVKQFGDIIPVYVEKLSYESYIAYELEDDKETISKAFYYATREKAESAARFLAKNNTISFLQTSAQHSVEEYRELGIILKEHPKDIYIALTSNGMYVVYDFDGYRKYNSGLINYHFMLESLEDAESYVKYFFED